MRQINELFPAAKKVYESLVDEQSKRFFELRFLYNLTLDVKYLQDMISLVPEFDSTRMQMKEMYDKIYQSYQEINNLDSPRKFIIYGAGNWGKIMLDMFSHLNWSSFCDKDPRKYNQTFCGLPVISPGDLLSKHSEDFIVIGTRKYHDEVCDELVSMGFPVEQILNHDFPFEFECLYDKQYFEDSVMIPGDDEIFVDAGCFDCGTSLLFKEWCHGKYEKIYAFEPDPSNYVNCIDIINNNELGNMELLNAGLWSENDTLHFNGDGNTCSSVSEEGYMQINVVSLDEVLQGRKVTFIKMDIEGSELEALKGAKDTIRTYRPRLAICIYHKHEDILEIPMYLQSLIPDYKFCIRHYSNTPNETVLYAI